MNLINKTALQCVNNVLRRTITKTAPLKYDGEGKTTLHIMNKDEDMGLMVDGYSQVGFKLNNNMTVLGPMIIFPRSVLAWNISTIEDINEDSLSLFKILDPKMDILVLGTGDRVENSDMFATFLNFSRKYKIALEILPTETACPTFNFLNAEGRNVAGALIPPQKIRYTEDDELSTRLRYQNVLNH